MDVMVVERSIWIDAPRERVWQAVSVPEQVAQWLLPPSLGAELKRDSSGKLAISLGPMNVDIAVIERVEPPQQMTSRGLPDGLIATTYRLDEENNGTQVTVTMTGFEALPPEARQDRLKPSGAGWEKALENLKAYVGGKTLPYPQGFVAALFGYRRDMLEKLAVERSIWIKAPVERVWHAISDPKQLEHWFSPGTQWHGTGLQVGGTFSVYDPATDTEMYTQMIEALDPPHRLVTREVPEPPEMPHVTEWKLAEENGGTRLTITYSGYEHEAADARYDNMEQNAFGFGMMLENLKAHVQGEPLPTPGGF